jgi:CRP/FNR family transcriptional regulator, cyclic AMP receptor protein
MSGFLDSLGPDERAALLRLARERRYPQGDRLVHEHDDAGAVLMVLEGRVVASTLGADGREVVLGVAGPGDIVGELSALRGQPRAATLTAAEPVRALAVPAADFRRFLAGSPAATGVLLDRVVGMLQDADAQRRELASFDVPTRVARRLVELQERFGTSSEEDRTELALTQDELAAWVGASREAVSKALAVLRTLGCVETHRRRVTITDADALRRHGRIASRRS